MEVYHDSKWGTVCDDGFTEEDAKVVCQSLGYYGGSTEGDVSRVGEEPKFGRGDGKIWIREMGCKGAEPMLGHCSINWKNNNYCNHGDDVSVKCELEPEM